MDGYFGVFNFDDAIERNLENMMEYGTSDQDEIYRLQKYAKKVLDDEKEKAVAQRVEEMLPDIQQKEREEAIKLVKAELTYANETKIVELSPFISETVMVNGQELERSMFIPNSSANDPISEDVKLFWDDINDRWIVRLKNGLPKLSSRFTVVSCLIVDASGPGSCRAFVIFLKGCTKPLIFWGGIINSAALRKQTNFQQRGLSSNRRDLYHESFVRALCNCKAVYFLTLPKHAGWNRTPSGSRIFVDSAMMKPEFEGLFLKDDFEDKLKKCNQKKLHNSYMDISLNTSQRKFENVAIDYHSLLPDSLPVKIGTVISVMSRILPHFKESELTQDRLWVVEAPDDDTAKSMVAVIQNKNHRSTEAILSSTRLTYLEEEMKRYVDCTVILRHSCNIGSTHDFEKILKLLYGMLQNTYMDNSINRSVPILIINDSAVIPEEFRIIQISFSESLRIEDIEQVQKIIGELHYHIVKFVERNPDAIKQRINESIVDVTNMVAPLPYRAKSSSAIMFLSTAIMLREGGLFSDADIQDMLQWLRTEEKSRTSMSRLVFNAVSDVLSEAICSERLLIANQFAPPFWTHNKVFVASDDSLNLIGDKFDEDILSYLDIPVGKNKALQYLEDENALFTNSPREHQRTMTVRGADGKNVKKRFISLSRDLLNEDAKKVVDKAISSDLFHNLNHAINNFKSLIRHEYLDTVAGQVISNYKCGNPFIAVTGSVGSGKSDFIMMQALQRAESGDTVIVLDPTNSFLFEELIRHRIPAEIIEKRFTFWDLTTQGWPVNLLDFDGCVNQEQKVQLLSSLLISGMHLIGDNQKAILMTKVTEWLEEYEINHKLSLYDLPGRFDGNAEERKLKKRLVSLFSTVKRIEDNEPQPPGWKEFLSKRGKIIVISCGNATLNVETNPFDILFDSLYAYKDKNKESKVTVILDEVQTFNHHRESTLVFLLSRGRKLNLAAIIASQDYLNTSLKKVYDYCGTKVFFRPMGDDCIKAVSGVTKLDVDIIGILPDFHCAIIGSIYSDYNKKNIQLNTAIVGKTYRPTYVNDYDDENE